MAVIGHVVGLQMVETEGRAGIVAEPQRHRRRKAQAARLDLVAAGDLAVFGEQVEPQRSVLGPHVVAVHGDALAEWPAEGDGRTEERRVGKGGGRKWKSRGGPEREKKK